MTGTVVFLPRADKIKFLCRIKIKEENGAMNAMIRSWFFIFIPKSEWKMKLKNENTHAHTNTNYVHTLLQQNLILITVTWWLVRQKRPWGDGITIHVSFVLFASRKSVLRFWPHCKKNKAKRCIGSSCHVMCYDAITHGELSIHQSWFVFLSMMFHRYLFSLFCDWRLTMSWSESRLNFYINCRKVFHFLILFGKPRKTRWTTS